MVNFNIQDVAIADINSLFVLRTDGRLRKGRYTNPGWVWSSEIDTQVGIGHSIAVMGNAVIVGPGAGSETASYSLDGGITFNKVTPSVPTAGGAVNTHVAFDPNFANNRTWYVSTDAVAGNISRWTIGSSVDYAIINATPAARFGMVMQASSVGYAARGVAGGGFDRTLDTLNGNPRAVGWNTLTAGIGGATFNSEPSAGKVTGSSPDVIVWAIDTSTNRLLAFVDSLTQDTPIVTKPVIVAGLRSALIQVAPNGFNLPFALHWDAVSTSSTYDYQLAHDPGFAEVILSNGPPYAPPNPLNPSFMIPANTLIGGQTYYARVKVNTAESGQVITSSWSSPYKLTVISGIPIQAPYVGPQGLFPLTGSTDNSVTSPSFGWTPLPGVDVYKFQLASDTKFQNILVSTSTGSTAYTYDGRLENDTSFFWRVQAEKPVPGDWSAVFNFRTAAKPAPPVTPPPLSPVVTNYTQPPSDETTPTWVWALISILALLTTVTIAYVTLTWKRPSP
jgi:hypothetical protein